ncbi:hypothetical protein BJ322DRAFT_1104562 [Thelephora terrestris]|uniref:F-box domain-containing protein n=1 Tax=Thelephora terrestris TaxID=56493 RepID=A0A9P6HPG7_9AGAM|nr:hypothetical protein BJ322DRAFT_1104562 [Thelephora terrestris]
MHMARKNRKRRGRSRALSTIAGVATKSCPGITDQPHSVVQPSAATLLPRSVIEIIIDHLHDRPMDLRACSLVAKSWEARSQSHLFRKVQWDTRTVLNWCTHISPHPSGPAGYVIFFAVDSLLEREQLGPIKDYFTSFRNVTSLILRDLSFDDPLFDPKKVPAYFGHLKLGLKSLTLANARGSCGRLLSFTSFFPHLEYLTISCPGDLFPPDPTVNFQYRPLRGTLFLRGHTHHTSLINLLSRSSPPQFHTVRLEHWGKMRIEDLNSLLKSCSNSLETLGLSACRGSADEWSSRLRPNFNLCPRLTEFRIELQNIAQNPPSIINSLLTSPVVLSRITFVIHDNVKPESLFSYIKDWAETDIVIARFAAKLFCRDEGKRLLLTFKVARVLDLAQLVPYSVERGVQVVVERGDDEELALPTCASCEAGNRSASWGL